jgi:hypothetical protein
MASRGLGAAKENPSSSRLTPRFAQRFWLPAGASKDIVLLDDESYNVWEHGLFIRGDSQASKIKVTCTDDTPDGDPRRCAACNAMLKGSKVIGRNAVYFLTIIELGFWTNKKGEKIYHTKRLLPLDKEMAMVLEKKKEAKGKSFVGAKFRVYRADNRSNRVGNDWDLEGWVKLHKFFADSPQLSYIIERERRFGRNITKKEAVDLLVSPMDYDTVLAPDSKKLRYMLTYVGLDVSGSPDDGSGEVDYSDPSLDGGMTSYDDDSFTPAGADDSPAADSGNGKKKSSKKKSSKKKSSKKKAAKKKKGLKKKGLKKKS